MSHQPWQPPPGYPQQNPATPQSPWGQPAPAAPPGYAQQPPAGYPQQPPAGYPAAPAPQQPWGQPAPAAPQGYPQQPPAGYAPQGYPAAPAANFDADPFAGMNSGEQIRSLPFLGNDEKDGPVIEGDYKLELRLVKYKPLRGGGKAIIVEVNILESNQPRRPAGSAASVFLMQEQDMSGINTTAFVAAVFGVDPVKIPKNSLTAPWADPQTGQPAPWGKYIREGISDANPWQGRRIGASVVDIPKKNGDRYGRVDWTPYDQMVIRQRTFAPAAPSLPSTPFVPQGAPGGVPGGFAPPGGFAGPGAMPTGAWQPAGAPPAAAPAYQPPAAPAAAPAQTWGQQPQATPQGWGQPQPGAVPPGAPWGQPPQR